MDKFIIIWALLIASDGIGLGLSAVAFWRMPDGVGRQVAKLFFSLAFASLATTFALILWPPPTQLVTFGMLLRMALRSVEVCGVWWFYLSKLKAKV